MYNIFYIYTYKYKKPSNTLTLSLSQCPHGPRLHKQHCKLYSLTSAERKPFIYGQKYTSRIMHQAIQLATCIYTAILKKLHNAFCVLVLSLFCNHIENVL